MSPFKKSHLVCGMVGTVLVIPTIVMSIHKSSSDMLDENRCRVGQWTVPQPVLAGPSNVIARFPHLAMDGRRSYVIGIDIQMFDDRMVPNDRLVVSEVGGRSLGRPSGRFAFLFPRAAVDSFGKLRLIWAEPDSQAVEQIEARRWIAQRPAVVWTAAYDTLTGWSAASRLQEATSRLRWPIRGGADTFGAYGGHQGIVIQTLGSESWWDQDLGRHNLAMPTGAVYPSLAIHRSHVYVAYIAAALDSSTPRSVGGGMRVRSDRNSVFFRNSDDGGVTWGRPRLVSLSGEYPAFGVHVMAADGGDIHLLWKQVLPSGATVIRHVLSNDGGSTWNHPDDLALPSAIEGMRAVIDACGAVHVVYEDWSDGHANTRIAYAAWNSHWNRITYPFRELTGMTPDIRVNADNDPTVVFVGRAARDTLDRFVTYVATLHR